MGHPPFRRLAILAGCVALLPLAHAVAAGGHAQGQLAIIDSGDRAYGYSVYSGQWTMTLLAGDVVQSQAGDYLGAIVTTQRIYAYKPTNDRWVSTAFAGLPRGLNVKGSTAVFWTQLACYGISTIWSQWNATPLNLGEPVRGGLSGGDLAIVWTTGRALCYSAATGQWLSQVLPEFALGGIACTSLGLVWTAHQAFAYSSVPGSWIPLEVGMPVGFTCGSGHVAMVWGSAGAQVFSTVSAQWYPLEIDDSLEGGSAGGDVALVWTRDRAYYFDATIAAWNELPLVDPEETGDGPPLASGAFVVGPNPCRGAHLTFRLPDDARWTIDLFDATGRQVRSLSAQTSTAGGSCEWDWTDDAGLALPAGTYWVRAQSGARSEARRIALLK